MASHDKKRMNPPDKMLKWLGVLFFVLAVVFLLGGSWWLFKTHSTMNIQLTEKRASDSRPQWNWFTAKKQPIAVKEDDGELQEADINAELKGIILTATQGFASISTPKKKDGVYKEGDEVEGNVTLVSIESDRVIINQRGIRKQLLLNELAKKNPIKQGENLMKRNSERLQKIDPSKDFGFDLSGLVSTQPVALADGTMGLKLSAVDSELASVADVKNGDTIISIDGSSVSEIFKNQALFRELSNSDSVALQLIRDDQPIEIFVNPRSVFQRVGGRSNPNQRAY